MTIYFIYRMSFPPKFPIFLPIWLRTGKRTNVFRYLNEGSTAKHQLFLETRGLPPRKIVLTNYQGKLGKGFKCSEKIRQSRKLRYRKCYMWRVRINCRTTKFNLRERNAPKSAKMSFSMAFQAKERLFTNSNHGNSVLDYHPCIQSRLFSFGLSLSVGLSRHSKFLASLWQS